MEMPVKIQKIQNIVNAFLNMHAKIDNVTEKTENSLFLQTVEKYLTTP